MNGKLKNRLIQLAKDKMKKNDLAHDVNHALRVLNLAEKIAMSENADLDIVVPAALFHDSVVYKGTGKPPAMELDHSAAFARMSLKRIREYPQQKINEVVYCISCHSFSKNVEPELLEARILQDADLLEATGAISIMRTFASSSVMGNKGFYNPNDPFCESRKPRSTEYSLDLFFNRLLIAKNRMHTESAKKMAEKRTNFLEIFLDELRSELIEDGVLQFKQRTQDPLF
jgi:uncharacterized protein